MIFDKIIGMFSSDLAMDLGTANTIVMSKKEGIMINEPSVVAVKIGKYGRKEVLAVGMEAKNMLGKTPGNIVAIRPMKDGIIADFDITEKMIRHFIEKTHGRKTFISPRIIICIPYGLTQVEIKAVREAAMSAGAREVFLIDEPMAAAIGAGINIKEPNGNLIVDIGGGTTEIGVTSLGGLVISKSIKVAGNKMDTAIINHIRRKFNLIIGEREAEQIKIDIGSALVLDGEVLEKEVTGRDQINMGLVTIKVTNEDIYEAMKDQVKEILEGLKLVIEQIPPDIASDIINNGIVLTGGGALIRNLDKYLSDGVKIPVYVADEPLLAVAKGTGKALEEIDMLGDIFSE